MISLKTRAKEHGIIIISLQVESIFVDGYAQNQDCRYKAYVLDRGLKVECQAKLYWYIMLAPSRYTTTKVCDDGNYIFFFPKHVSF